MKKLYFLLFFCFFLNGFGQTPTYTFTYSIDFFGDLGCPSNYSAGDYYCSFNGYVDRDILPDPVIGNVKTKFVTYTNVPSNLNQSNFELTFHCECEDEESYYNPPRQERIYLFPVGNFIENGLYSFTSMICPIRFYNADIKPNNLSINNIGSKTEVCAGEMLNLAVTPDGFHKEVYHWQYSLDNKATWKDVPAKKVNGLDITNVKTSNFTIYDILGDDHVNHFGPIDFRIGYGGGSLTPINYSSYHNDGPSRPFSTNTIRINYIPCAPVVTDVNYEGPKCNGDAIQKLEISFDRPLDASKGESIYQLYIRETTNNASPIKTTPMFSVGNVTYPDDSKIYSYSNFLQFSGLENGREYEVMYQAQMNHPFSTEKIPKGLMVSAKKFTYNEPAVLKFEIKKADNPICFGDLAEVSIAVTGGTGDYKFYVDGVEKTSPKPVKEADGYYHVKGLVPTAVNSIKVMDENNCIEKNP
ncbi:hypothetical protein [Flavobacterium fluviatile]|uniref:hypothetical protein n=1 Tax=Flavobacterium fluviatile TaxID=1862387 RepID=UPI0013D07068|nr:hypothetical protein [Flavobacterium fluviatile]